jgi:hypothetical protein
MVHGGGHHSSSTGGGGSTSVSHHHGGGSRSVSHHHQWNSRSNVVVVNQQRGYNSGLALPWYTGGPWWSSTNPQYRDSDYYSSERSTIDGDARECRECCRRCYTAFLPACCLCSSCCAAREVARSAARNGQGTSPVYERLSGDEETSTPNKLCQAFCLSIVILVALLAFSQLDTNWTLNAGETRHVKLPFLNNRVDISTDDKIGVRVYDFPDKKCPSLTGPMVTLEDENTLILGTGDYQYDYFFLNKGSVINLDFHQTKGATNIYILKGESNLQRLEGDTDEDDVNLHRQALKKRYVAEGGHSSGSFQYTAKQNNVYMLVYDNVSPATTGTISVHYTITLTTYNLHGQEPVCDESVDTCSINLPNRRRCILVQAISVSGGHTSDEIVSVEVTGTRCWSFLLFYSAMPFIFFLLRSICQLRSSRSSYHPVDSSEEPNPPPTAPESVEPPTAPHSESNPLPSAPTEARLVEADPDYSVIIVIPAENVIPVPPPTDK